MTAKIGLLEPDSSHGERFAEIFNLDSHPSFWSGSGVRIKSIWGTDINRSRQLAEYGQIPVIAKTPEDVVNECDYIFVLARHPNRHLNDARHAIKKGKPVFVDKPLADTAERARHLIAMAKKSEVPMISFSTLRYASDTVKYGNKLSDIAPIRFSSYLGPASRKSPYGGLSFYGIHTIELMLHFHGTCVETVSAIEHVKDSEESNIVVVCTYEDGTLVTLGLLGDAAYHFRLTAVGRKGVADMPLGLDDNYLMGMRELIPVLRGERTSEISNEEMLMAVCLTEAIEMSLLTGRPVSPGGL